MVEEGEVQSNTETETNKGLRKPISIKRHPGLRRFSVTWGYETVLNALHIVNLAAVSVVVLGKLIVTLPLKNFLLFVEPERSLPCLESPPSPKNFT
jgi:hypothetical protein